MLKNLARHLLSLFGWTLLDPPQRPPRAVVVGYPHTSNWDALYAQLGKLALGLNARWVGKDNLFRWLGRVKNDNPKKEYFITDIIGPAMALSRRWSRSSPQIRISCW